MGLPCSSHSPGMRLSEKISVPAMLRHHHISTAEELALPADVGADADDLDGLTVALFVVPANPEHRLWFGSGLGLHGKPLAVYFVEFARHEVEGGGAIAVLSVSKSPSPSEHTARCEGDSHQAIAYVLNDSAGASSMADLV